MHLFYRSAADLVVIVHLMFVTFVVFGAVLVLRWRWLAAVHVPALLWGIYTEFFGVVCPLTPIEVALRQLGGQTGYEGDFVTHYLLAVLYPADLTRTVQAWLGIAALIPNLLIYGRFLRNRARRD
ncbi:MAG TPA: DUF2784 domain-containing protein [Steroidobacteraceae bacterium]